MEPYQNGMPETGDGNAIHREPCGSPDRVPTLVVHGGPAMRAALDRAREVPAS